ncbi:MAG: hypothetical protein QG594_2438 [Bacteroidota bacterium]|nr:hypothetical protein [Bacteroidota bacterium]
MEIFNEQKLRAEIAKTWGEHGAHIEVYDMLLKKANVVLPQADVIKSVCEIEGCHLPATCNGKCGGHCDCLAG